MTCIAAKDGTIAADTQLTGDFMYRVQKIFTLHDGSVAGACGCWHNVYPGLQWLINGEVGEPPKIKGGVILMIRPDGSLWMAEERLPAFPLLDKFAAIGSGGAVAMAAMLGGATAAEAVGTACKLDSGVSAPVQVLSIVTKPKKRRK